MGKIFDKIRYLIIDTLMQLGLLLLFAATFLTIYIITFYLIIRDKIYGIRKEK